MSTRLDIANATLGLVVVVGGSDVLVHLSEVMNKSVATNASKLNLLNELGISAEINNFSFFSLVVDYCRLQNASLKRNLYQSPVSFNFFQTSLAFNWIFFKSQIKELFFLI